MVKIAGVLFVVLLCAVPLMAQDEYPRIQTSLGYANLNLVDFGSVDPASGFLSGATTHHSGFANETSFNLTPNLGLSNYMGIYGLGGSKTLGSSVTMISDFFGGKAMYRAAKAVPYGLAGIGFGYLTSNSYGLGSSFATRFGAGVDVPISDSLAWKFEVSRMSFHLQTTLNSAWTSGTNFQTGIVFTIAQ